MNKASKMPFHDMPPEGWQNLALAGLLFFYVAYLLLEVALRTMCGQIGMDYCDYVGAGAVANHYGYVKIYDLGLLDQAEKRLLPPTADPGTIPVNIFPYLPVFVIPFQALALISPEISFWIWTVVKIAAMIFYLRFFARALDLQSVYPRLLLLVFACLPVFQNIFSGQVDVWLMICVGEFLRALVGRHPLRAGIWLGGLLLKPQVLIIIGLILLLQRAARVLAGFAISALGLTVASFALIGPSGTGDLMGLWLLYLRGHPSNLVEGMMNWRMLGMQAETFAGPGIGYATVVAGIIGTLLVCFLAWGRRLIAVSSPAFVRPLLGILAATTLVAWHAHIFTAMILIPPMLYLYAKRILPGKIFAYWALIPATLYFISAFVPEVLQRLSLHVDHIATAIYVVLGTAQFAVNSYLLWWSSRSSFGSDPVGASSMEGTASA